MIDPQAPRGIGQARVSGHFKKDLQILPVEHVCLRLSADIAFAKLHKQCAPLNIVWLSDLWLD